MSKWSDKFKPIRGDYKSLAAPGAPSIAEAERVMDLQAGLAGDLKLVRRGLRRSSRDLRQLGAAEKHLERLPEVDESFHLVNAGLYALWQIVPAVLALASPATIATLHVCTLGFSKDNTEALFTLIDEGRIGHVVLLCSH